MKFPPGKKKEWGIDFSQIIYNPKDDSIIPTDEDIDYILDKFIEAVEKRGLVCGGGCSPIRLDIITCSNCLKEEALDGEDYCKTCLDKIATRHGYVKKGGNK